MGMKGSGCPGFKEDEYVGPMETQEDGLEKFPTFYPRDYYNPNIHDSFNNFNHQVGPVGSGRPDRQIPRNVWPGAQEEEHWKKIKFYVNDQLSLTHRSIII